MTNTTIWRGLQVEAETGFSRSTILRRCHAGLFPRPVALGRRSVGWPAQEVTAVNAATIRGESEADVRQLVCDLEKQRRTLFREHRRPLESGEK